MTDRLIEIEKKLAFQENSIEELNQIILDQERRINELTQQLNMVQKKITHNSFEPPEQDERPPHY